MDTDYRYLNFSVLDYTNSQITSGYTLPITPFTFIPKFDAGDGHVVSNTRIIWDFGDGTFSRDITATHYFKIPGTYSVKCYFYGASGIGYESSFVQNILVRDFISDTLVLSAKNNPIIRTSRYECPFLISRFNSWQTYNSLSSEGASICLEVSGNSSPILDVENYYLDKYAHLKPSARFLTLDYNETLSAYDAIPVKIIKTRNNVDLYVKINNFNDIVFCKKDDPGSVLAGTSGQSLIYYTDDTVRTPDNKTIKPATISIYFDYNNFYDVDNIRYNINESYSVLNGTAHATYSPYIHYIEELNCVSFSTNGIDSEGNFDIATFKIGKNKYPGQKIPFVAKVKDYENFTSKAWKKFTLVRDNEDMTDNSIKFYLKDTVTNTIIPSAFDIYEDYGEFENYERLGFFKGYIIPKVAKDNVSLCCDVNSTSDKFLYVDTNHTIITNPQSTSIYKLDLVHDYTTNIFDEINTSKNVYDTKTLSGMYASIIVPSYKNATISHTYWTIDSDQDLIARLEFDNNDVTVGKIRLPANSSPSHLAADKHGSVWVTLYDSVSVCKIDSTGIFEFFTAPNLTNVDYSSNSYYIPNRGAAGSNSILPAIVDVDVRNNAWVVYNFSLSSFICVYDSQGNVLTNYEIPLNYIGIDIICTYEQITWILLKNKNNFENDGLLKINQGSGETTLIPIDHKVWAFSYDTNNNLWFIANKNDILLKSYFTDDVIYVRTVNSTSNIISPDCNFNGIASTTQGSLLIFDYIDSNIKIFNINELTNDPNNASIKTIELNDINTNGFYQNFINTKGDPTGFKYIEKFLYGNPQFSKQGCCSNKFNINPLSGTSIAKLNENFDMTAQIKNFSFQETLKDSSDLFDIFLEKCLGSNNESPTLLGKKIYEKISNFVDNNSFIDTCNIEKLNSIHKLLNENLYIFNTYNFPPNITRLLDLFSIKLSKLKGSRNKFNENFDTKGYTENSNTIYGKNLGEKLNFLNSLISINDGYIVAHERFSDTYTLCNTNVLTANFIGGTNTYPLSSYTPLWGWSLVLPKTYDNYEIEKYYTFYKYISTYSNEQLEGIINWSDKLTTMSESISSQDDWWNLAENIITRELMVGLQLLSSNS
jgi:hypothetical protein